MDFFVFQQNLVEHQLQFVFFLMPLAVLGILYGSIVPIFETNLKRLLAFSSIAQIGYILLGASLISVTGFTAAVLHFFNHALAKAALFLAAACLGMRVSGLQLEDLSGIGRQMPWTLAAFALAGMSLIGIPGTAGFVSKWVLIEAVLAEGFLGAALLGVILISSLLSVIYIARVVELMWHGERGREAVAIGEAPTWMLTVTWALVLANVWFGLDARLPSDLAGDAAASFLRHLP